MPVSPSAVTRAVTPHLGAPPAPPAGMRLLVAAVALLAALVLAGFGPALAAPPRLALWLGGVPALGLLAVAAAGVLAWHLARITTGLHGRATFHRAALLPALLPAIVVPGAGAATLLPAALLAIAAGRHDRRAHLVALLVQCAVPPVLIAAAHPIVAAAIGSHNPLGSGARRAFRGRNRGERQSPIGTNRNRLEADRRADL